MEKIDALESCVAEMRSTAVDEEEHAMLDQLTQVLTNFKATKAEKEKDMLDQLAHVALDDATKTLPAQPDDDDVNAAGTFRRAAHSRRHSDLVIKLPAHLQHDRLSAFNNKHGASCPGVWSPKPQPHNHKEPTWGNDVHPSPGQHQECLNDVCGHVKRSIYRTTPIPKRAALREKEPPEEVASFDSPRVAKKAGDLI